MCAHVYGPNRRPLCKTGIAGERVGPFLPSGAGSLSGERHEPSKDSQMRTLSWDGVELEAGRSTRRKWGQEGPRHPEVSILSLCAQRSRGCDRQKQGLHGGSSGEGWPGTEGAACWAGRPHGRVSPVPSVVPAPGPPCGPQSPRAHSLGLVAPGPSTRERPQLASPGVALLTD